VVRANQKKEIKEVELYGRKDSVEIVSRHQFGISIITLSYEDVLELREELDEWLAEQQQKTLASKNRDLTC
jgi:hypothetical protein